MKVINVQQENEVEFQENFVEEAQIGAQLQHPGIVPVYEMGNLPSGNLYFTMKEIKGRTLKEVIKTALMLNLHTLLHLHVLMLNLHILILHLHVLRLNLHI